MGHARGRRRIFCATDREATRRAAVGGWLTLGAYLCILVALERGAAVRGRAAARVGDGLRRGLGLGPAGRGDATGREAVRRIGASVLIVGGALLLRGRRLTRGRSAAAGSRTDGSDRLDRAATRPNTRRRAEPAVDQADAGDDAAPSRR